MLTTNDMFTGAALPMDAQQTVRQIPMWTRVELNCREYASDEANGLLWMTVLRKSSRYIKKVVVRLNGLDLYDVRVIRYDRRELDNEVLAEADNIYGENLGDVIRRLVEGVA